MNALYLCLIILLVVIVGTRFLVALSGAQKKKNKQSNTEPRYRPAIIKRYP
jgi:hypothetical protein